LNKTENVGESWTEKDVVFRKSFFPRKIHLLDHAFKFRLCNYSFLTQKCAESVKSETIPADERDGSCKLLWNQTNQGDICEFWGQELCVSG